MKKSGLALFFTIVMIISMLPVTVFGSELLDMPNNWSTVALEKAVANGLLKGDNGKIMSDESLTRAQMATIVNRAFGTVEKSSLSGFTDVEKGAWYYDEMAKAVQMKTFVGSEEKLNPNNRITREEAFVVLARAFKISEVKDNILDKFSDKTCISDWAKDGVSSLVSAGYIAGSNGQINPKQDITRAEFAQIMDNLIGDYINADGTYTTDYSGNLMINVPNVILKGLTVTGDLIIGDGVGNGDVTLDDVTVAGRIVIRGGGENSIKIVGNSNIQNIIIARVDGKVRVYSEGGTEIGDVIIDGNDDVIIEGNVGSLIVAASGVTVTANNANIESASILIANSNIIIGKTSAINTVTINAGNATVEVIGKATNILTTNQAQNAKINVASGAKVDNVIVNSNGTKIEGSGNVQKVTANANNVEVKTLNTSVAAAEGTTGVMAGDTKVVPGKTETTQSESSTISSSGGNSNKPKDVIKGTIERSKSINGGEKATVAIDGQWITFNGEIARYIADENNRLPVSGNWVGVKITAPVGVIPDVNAVIKAHGEILNLNGAPGWDNIRDEGDGDNYFHLYQRVPKTGYVYEIEVKWNNDLTETYYIKIPSTATLEVEVTDLENIIKDAQNIYDDFYESDKISYEAIEALLTAIETAQSVYDKAVEVKTEETQGDVYDAQDELISALDAFWDSYETEIIAVYDNMTANTEYTDANPLILSLNINGIGDFVTEDTDYADYITLGGTLTGTAIKSVTFEGEPANRAILKLTGTTGDSIYDGTITIKKGGVNGHTHGFHSVVVPVGTVERSKSINGGEKATVTIDGQWITFNGEIAYYIADEVDGLSEPGNYVGVKITAPAGVIPDGNAVLTAYGEVCNLDGKPGWDNIKKEGDGDNYFHLYQRVTQTRFVYVIEIKWNDHLTETYFILIPSTATLGV